MSLLEHAKIEMDLFNGKEVDEMQKLITENIMELIKVFSDQGHSGSSAPYVLNLFCKLAKYETLLPVSFEKDQWIEHEYGTFQNKRNSAVFKEGENGRPYYINAYVECWESEPSNCWSGSLALEGGKGIRRCYIKDPAKMPKIKILIPLAFNNGGGDWEFKEVKESVLDELK